MGYYVFTSIIFPINTDGERRYDVKKIARSHYDRLSKIGTDGLKVRKDHISLDFLVAIMEGKCVNCSHKGEGCAYAATGNYTNIEGVVEDLLPFFDDLWATDEAIFDFEHVLIMTQNEQRSCVRIAEIVSKKHAEPSKCEYRSLTGRVTFYTQEHSWHWHQM